MRIFITEKNEVIPDIVRTNDFAQYIDNLGFFLFRLPNAEVLSVRSKRVPGEHLFTVPKIMRDYPDEYQLDKVTHGVHPTYNDCLKKADYWHDKVKRGYFRELNKTKHFDQFYE